LAKRGEKVLAREQLRVVADTEDRSPNMTYNMGLAYYEIGEYEKDFENFREPFGSMLYLKGKGTQENFRQKVENALAKFSRVEYYITSARRCPSARSTLGVLEQMNRSLLFSLLSSYYSLSGNNRGILD
jgi:hypothetical protein